MGTVIVRNRDDLEQVRGLILAEGLPCTVSIGEQRTHEQNSKLWPMLEDVAKQVELCVNGQMVKAAKEDWKNVFMAAYRKETRIAVGIDGGMVFLGESTSRLRKKEFSDLIELIYAFGSSKQVVWSEPSIKAYEQYREAA